METGGMDNSQEIAVVRLFADVLDALGIRYAIGGSMASSIYGTVRFTQDADITVEPFTAVCEKLYEMLKKDFYIGREAMEQALRARSGFNIIHFATAFKIDIFVQAENEFQRQMLSRGRKLRLSDSAKAFVFVSPEDIILLKLDWYRQSGCASERQWSDVQGVLAGQGKALDIEYIRNCANKLGLAELLTRAISESET
jgi:hypothetical protein